MKSYLRSFITLLLTVSLLAAFCVPLIGCEKREKVDENVVVCSIFPIYDWTRELLRGVDNVKVKLLVDNGADLHSYQATADDIIAITACGKMIYVGGESDGWISDTITAREKNPEDTLVLLDILGDRALIEELVPGMQEEEGEEEEEEEETDEHVWLSLRNATLFVRAIEQMLCEAYPTSAAAIHENAARYTEGLTALDREFTDLISPIEAPTILVADRFPFAYLARDYGLTYYAAFAGCSAESEANFETIRFLSERVDELGLTTIYTIDGGNGAIAETVKATTKEKNQNISKLQSMQSVTLSQAQDGVTYIELMKENLNALKESLK